MSTSTSEPRIAEPFKVAKTLSQGTVAAAEISQVSILAIVQSVALAATLVLVWVSIAVAEDLHASGLEDAEPAAPAD